MEYFGTFNMLIVTQKDIDTTVIIDESNFYDVVTKIKETKKWDNYDLVFYDFGDGKLLVLKDNTSKFSVPKFLIHK